jgi:hypothetical protein
MASQDPRNSAGNVEARIKNLDREGAIDAALSEYKPDDWEIGLNPEPAYTLAMMAARTEIERRNEIELEAEILRAIAKSRYPKKDLSKVARVYGVPLDTVEDIAKKLAGERGLDLEQCEFNGMIAEVQKAEQIPDMGYRSWMLQSIARKYKRSKKELMESYSMALSRQQPLKPLTMSELMASNKTQASWIIQGWLPAGVAILLHALGGTGKTLMMYEIAAAIAKGQAWNDYPVKQGRVLILQSDEPPHITQERLETLGVSDADPLRVFPGWQVEQMPQLESYLQSQTDSGSPVRFLLVDSITGINRSTSISENDVEYARPVSALADLASRFGACLVLIHHSNGFGESRGTKALHNAVSEVWSLILNNEQTGERILRVHKTRVGRAPGRYKFDFNPSTNAFTYKGEDGEDESATATHAKRIELWISEPVRRGTPYEIEEIVESLGVPAASARRSVSEMWAKGILKRDRRKRGNHSRFLYWYGDLKTEFQCDHSNQYDHSIRSPITLQNPLTEQCDQCDHPKDEKRTNDKKQKIEKNDDQRSHCSESGFQRDHQCDHPPLPSDHIDFIASSDHIPGVGDTVVAKGTAVWWRSGSDKINARTLRPSQKDCPSIPVTELPDEIFHELTAPCLVIDVKVGRLGAKRLKLRNKVTGRSWVCSSLDVEVLTAAGQGIEQQTIGGLDG